MAEGFEAFDVSQPRHPSQDERYCPYCNQESTEGLTYEHVIPESIGGDDRATIWVCKSCNDLSGRRIDVLLARNTGLSFLSARPGRLMKRQGKHRSKAKLKDGRDLDGYFYWKRVGTAGMTPGFSPLLVQKDGSKWIHERALRGNVVRPEGIYVFRDTDLDTASFSIDRFSESGIEPAMAKILLGMMYQIHGRPAVSKRGFDHLRGIIRASVSPAVLFDWLDPQADLRAIVPMPILASEHGVWGECRDASVFVGGVSLFGRAVIQIRIRRFGIKLKGSQCRIPISNRV